MDDIKTKVKKDPLFNRRNVAILATGIALGVILKQQSEIRNLKRVVGLLEGVIRQIPVESATYLGVIR